MRTEAHADRLSQAAEAIRLLADASEGEAEVDYGEGSERAPGRVEGEEAAREIEEAEEAVDIARAVDRQAGGDSDSDAPIGIQDSRPGVSPSNERRRLESKIREAERELARIEAVLSEKRKRERMLDDLLLFCREICGFEDLNPKLHGEVARFLKSGDALVILLPREHLKSSLVTVGYTCQQIARDPNIRVCIYSVTQDLSRAFLRQIRAILRSPRFQKWYGDRVPPTFEADTVDYLTVRRTMARKEPTVYVTSVGSSQVGFHFDLNIYDDIVDNKTVMTEGALAKTEQWYQESLALHEKHSKLIYVGTRWHDNDLAGRLLANSSYRHLVHAAIEHGMPIFPEKFSLERLRRLRAQMSARTFACQYMNDPVPPEEQMFREEDLQVVTELPDGDTYMTIDPATGPGSRTDRSAIVVVRTDAFRRITLAEIWIGRPDPGELIDRIIDLCEKWRPAACGLEKVAYQHVLSYFLQKEMIHTNRYWPVTALTPGTRHKEERIMALEPFFRRGKICIWAGCPHREELVSEMIRFPRGRTDDILDALAYALDLVTFPSAPEPEPEALPSGEELLKDWYAWKHTEFAGGMQPILGADAVRKEARWLRTSTSPGTRRFPILTPNSPRRRGR